MEKSMIYLRRLLALCTLMVAFAACKDDDNNSAGGDITLQSSVSEVLTSEGGKKEIVFTATGDWVAVPSKGWLKLDNVQGGAGQEQKIALTVATNESFSDRVGTVIVKDRVSGKQVEVTIKQGLKGASLTFSEEATTLEIDNENREIVGTVIVASNYEWNISIPDIDWLTYQIVHVDGNNRTVKFYAEPDKMNDYNARRAVVHFNYISKTRMPEVKSYNVSFEGVRPEIKFVSSFGGEEISEAVLVDNSNIMEYAASFKVVTNLAWKFQQLPDFAEVEIPGGNNSSKFFTTETPVVIGLKAGKLDTETLAGELSLLDLTSNEVVKALPVKLPGVGSNFVFIDNAAFPPGQMDPCFMFDSKGADEWSSITKIFTVKASQPSLLKFYMVKLASSWGSPQKMGVDQFGEVSNDVTDYWGGVDTPAQRKKGTRSPVLDSQYELWLKSRSDFEGAMSNPKENRYFALFAVSEQQAPDYDALFDEEGELKEEFESSYIRLGQNAKAVNYYFFSEQVSEGQVLKVGAAGKEMEISYESNAADGINIYDNVVRYSDDPFDWNGGSTITLNDMFEIKSFTDGKIVIKVTPNTTGAKRVAKCGFSAYVPNSEKEFLLITFTVEQAAE